MADATFNEAIYFNASHTFNGVDLVANRTFLGTINSDFNTAGNWDGGVSLPSAGDNIQISANAILDANETNVYGTLLIDAGKTFDIATYDFSCGAVTANGTFKIGSSSSTGFSCSAFTSASSSTITANTDSKIACSGAVSIHASTTITNATIGQWTLTGNSANINFGGITKVGALIINCTSGQTKTNQSNFTATSFTGTVGTFVDGGYTITIGGNIVMSDGFIITSTGSWVQSASGNLKAHQYGMILKSITINDGITCTQTGVVYTKKVIIGNATVTGNWFYMYPDVNDFWSQHASATVNSGLFILLPETHSNANAINIGSNTFILSTGKSVSNFELTQTANITCGIMYIGSASAGNYIRLNQVSGNITSPTLYMGTGASADNAGEINLGSGTHAFTSIQRSPTNTSVANIIRGNSSTITVTSTFNLTGITWTASSETLNLTSGNATINPDDETLYNVVVNTSGAKSFSGNGIFNRITFNGGTVNSSVSGTLRTLTVATTSAATNTTFKDISMGSANKINAKASGNVNQGNTLGIVFTDNLV